MTPIMKLKKKFYFIIASYFRFFANFSLKRWHPRIIAITGSVGKTTMLNLLEYTFGKQAHYSNNANSAFGIAFDIVGMRGVTGSKLRWLILFLAVPIKSFFYRHHEEFYIVEIDGERPYETEFLASWLKPEVTLWISLGLSHAVQFEQQVKDGIFDSLDKAITHEFAMLPQYTRKLVIIDEDVELMNRALASMKEKKLTEAKVVKCSKKALVKYHVEPNFTKFTICQEQLSRHQEKKDKEESRNKDKVKVKEYVFNRPMSKDLAIQLVMLEKLSNYLKIDLDPDFSLLTLAPGRNSFFEGKNNLKIIDSSYNAHLISVKSVLEMFSEIKIPHKWLVIGDIVDQGSIEGEEHQKLASEILNVRPEQVILVGHRTKKYTAPLLKKVNSLFTTNSPKEALKFIEQNTKGGETLLFKGSQYLEWIIEKLLKDPSDIEKLPRRERAAVKRRKKRGLN